MQIDTMNFDYFYSHKAVMIIAHFSFGWHTISTEPKYTNTNKQTHTHIRSERSHPQHTTPKTKCITDQSKSAYSCLLILKLSKNLDTFIYIKKGEETKNHHEPKS